MSSRLPGGSCGPARGPRSLPALAIARPVTTAMVFLGLALVGIVAWEQLPVQLLPNYELPRVWIQVVHPGASPDGLERDVLRRLEGEIATISGVEEISSSASTGQASIEVAFSRDADLDLASLRVQQRLAAVKDDLPEQVLVGLQRFDTSVFSNFVMILSLRGDADLAGMRSLAEDQVVPLLQGVNGVVQVATQGGASRQLAVIVDPERARASGASLLAVREALAGVTRPVQGVGDVRDGSRTLPVVLDRRARSVSDVAIAPVGARSRLADVAELQLALASSVERYRVNGQTSVGLFAYKDPQANLIQIARDLRVVVAEFNARHSGEGRTLAIDFDAAEIIEENMDTLLDRALTGAILALLVLLVFLRDLRSVAVVGIAVPAALLVAAALFRATGLTLNVLSLLGLALSVGMLLDNSIVVLESITARREKGDSPREAAGRGVSRVLRATIAGTATTVIVFVPLFVVTTDLSPLFHELALSVALPLLASLLVALTLVPVIASRVGARRASDTRVRSPGPWGLPQPGIPRTLYSAVLRAALRAPLLTMAGLLGLVVATIVFGLPLIVVFAEPPRPSQERIELRATLPQGATTETADSVALQLEGLAEDLPELDEIRTSLREDEVTVSILFKEAGDRSGGLHVGRARERLRQQVSRVEENVKGSRIEVDPPPPQEQLGGQDIFGQGGTRETVRVHGPAGSALDNLATLVKQRVEQVHGLEGVRWDVADPRPTVEVTPNRDELARHDLSVAEVMAILWATRREGEATRTPLRLGDEDVDLALYVRGADERTIDDVRRFPLTTRGGARIPLSEVASVTTGSEPPIARRWQRERTVTITYGFDAMASGSADAVRASRAAVDRAVGDLARPEGHYVDVEHADEGLSSTRHMIYLGLALVFVVLAVTFESVTLPFLVMLSVPLAAVGVIGALVVTGTGANQFVMLALVVLLGIVVNQGILFVDRSEELRSRGASRATATLRAAHDRLRPILMTTASTTVGMIPLAVSTGGEQEIWPPFARALLGGLVSATLISLVFIPCGALAFGWLRDLLVRLTPPIVIATTAAWGLLLWWGFFVAEIVVSEPLRWLLAIPAWLLALAAARAGQYLWSGERPPDLVGDADVALRVRNARKIYGGPPRFVREFRRIDRWKDIAERAGLTASEIRSPRQARLALTWQAGALGLLGYVNSLAESSWGLFLLTIPTLAILSALAASLAVLARVPGAWPLRGWPARILPLAAAAGAWMYLLLRRREDSAADVATLVVAGIAYGTWALLHLAREGGAVGMLRRRVSPPPVVALDGVSLSFENGLYGLLGPNGAGKSTLMRLVVNLYRPTRGTVTVNGHEVHANAASIQPRIGYLPQFFGVPPRLSAREYLHHQALLAGQAEPAKRAELVEAVLSEVGLTNRADEKLGGYSGGMRQRIGIARTLLNVPRIVVVDEPTVGLDPRERIRFRNLLAELAKTRIVLLSTHVVEDIGSSCREVIVLDRGLVLFRGTPVDLVARARGHAWTCDVAEAALQALSRLHRVVTTTRMPDGIVRVRGVGPRPADATDVDATLEDAYLLLLGRSSRELPDAA